MTSTHDHRSFQAKLRRVEGSTAEIEAGPLRMKVAVDEITGVEEEARGKSAIQPSKRENITVSAQSSEGGATDEINVIGLTVEHFRAKYGRRVLEARVRRPHARGR